MKARAVIRQGEKIFLVRDKEKGFFYLPGGTMENNETIKECLLRELQEELGRKAEIGKLLHIEEFKNSKGLNLDFWFDVLNNEEFSSVDENASHAFEFCDAGFYSQKDMIDQDLRPKNLFSLCEGGNDFVLLD